MEETVEDLILIQVKVPDINVEKTLQFSRCSLIWEAKQQILAALPKELDEGFNYGLFLPPNNCKAGKFMDEERTLSEYPFQSTLNTIEMKYKRKVYKELNLDQKQLKQINSKSNQKKFIEYISSNNVEKISKLINKGLDPNFHCPDSGETPLSLCTRNPKSSRSILVLVNGGALIDYRTKDGSTAMHRGVSGNNYEAVKTMLDLGGSPNYRDGKGLTPLYLSVAGNTDPNITQVLLHERAVIGTQDLQGWAEVHQCCRSGLVQHLEYLLFYQADCNARNASGNTPLHVCAVNNQDGCARLLLFRGADREVLNYAGQTAYQVSIIAGNHELAEIIQNHNPATSVAFTELPKFNPRRRVSNAPLSRTMSDCGSLQYDTLRRIESPLTGYIIKPSSPSLSDRSLPPFSSGSSVSGTSTGSGGSNSTSQEEQLDSASTLAASMTGNEDVLSLSSGVGTSSNSGSGGSAATPTGREVVLLPGSTVISTDDYNNPSDPSHLQLSKGDVIEVVGSTDSGLLEGVLRGRTGLLPRHLVQEVRFRSHANNKEVIKENDVSPRSVEMSPRSVEVSPRVGGRREGEIMKHFGTATKSGVTFVTGLPRQCVLHKGRKGFGFVLRGAKAASPLMDMIPSHKCPSLQYMDDVDPGGVADMAGIKKGDFLLAINNEDVTTASHETVVNLIRKSGDLVQLNVLTVTAEYGAKNFSSTLPTPRGFSTLPRKPGGRTPLQHPPPPPRRDPATTLSVGRARAKSMVANLAAMDTLSAAIREKDPSLLSEAKSEDALNQMKADGGDGSTKLFARELELIFRRNSGLTAGVSKEVSSTSSSPLVTVRNFSSVAQMKKHKKGNVLLHSQFNSTPDLQATKHGGADETLDTEIPDLEEVVMTRRSVSQENLNSLHLTPHTDLKDGSNHTGYYTLPSKGRRGQWAGKEDYLKEEEVYRTVTRIRPVQIRVPTADFSSPTSGGEGNRALGPAPSHPPPPPPPVGQMVTLSGTNPDYAKVSPVTGPASSFKPAVNARLYESPKGIPDVAYKSSVKSDDVGAKKRSPTRTHSLPPRPSKPLVLKRVEEPVGGVERYKVNGVNYTTYTTFRSPLTPDTDTRFDDEEDSSRTPTNELTPEEDQETTYSGYPGPEPPYQEYPGPGTPEPYPGVYPGGVPHIPEPDYDISDLENCENGSYSGSDSSWRQDQEQFRDTATLRRNQRNERKKKKTVSFIMNQDIANIIHSSGTMTKKDSILKDTKHHVDVGEEPGCWRPTRRSPTKSVPPPPTAKSTPPKSSLVKESMFATKKKPVVKGGVIPPHLEWEGGSLPAHPEWVEEPEYEVWQPAHPGNDQRSVEMTVQPTLTSNSKIRIEIGNQVQKPSTPTLAKSISFSNHLNPTNQANQTSPNHVKQTINHGKSSSPRTNSENNIDLKPRDHGSDSLINKSDIQKARSQLKSSRSLPDIVDEQDNSSSGVSSDQDIHQDSDFVTQLTVSPLSLPPVPAGKPWGRSTDRWPRTTDDDSQSSGTGSSHSDDLTDKTWILQSEKDLNGRNMNMMSSKEKEMKREGSSNGLSVQSISGHSAVHSGSTLPSQQYNANTLRKEPVEIEWSQENHYQNSAIKLEKSLPQLGDHVNVRRPFRSDDRMSRSFCQESSTLSRVESLMTSGRAQLKNGMSTSVLDRCRTIDESLALINHHVKDLNQPELYEGVPPPPSSATPSLSICPSPRSDESPPLLAPPPGFSDSDLSLTSDPGSEAGGGFQRFGASRVSRAINPAVSARERGTVDVKRINSDFRSRSLLEWSESDVCDWLDSLFIPEYKAAFRDSGVNGARLATLDNRDWERLGVVKIVHRLNILKSIKRYMPKK